MTISRQAAATVTTIVSLARRKLNDPATTPAGVAIPEGLRRWTDAAITETISEALTDLDTLAANEHPAHALTYVDATYTEGDGNIGMSLPAAVGANGLVAIDDITSPRSIVRYAYVPSTQIEDYDQHGTETISSTGIHRFWSVYADPTATTTPPFRFKVRPIATGRSLRLWYITSSLIADTGTDIQPLGGRWNQLIASAVAVKLLSITEDVPTALASLYAAQLDQFVKFLSNRRGSEHITLRRLRSC